MHGSSVISRLKDADLRIDRICRRFEQSWRQNRRVSIEHCLSEVEILERPRLLEELIAAEWELRFRRGEVPSAADYLLRFSEHRQLVETICGVMQFEFDQPEARLQKLHPQEGDQLGDYRIIREVGRGGMGIVFEARQESLGRQVALKVLPARRFQNERELLRFRREAQSVARLHHSNIVEIYGVGEQEGVHYFAMRFIVGRSLDEVIRAVSRRPDFADVNDEIEAEQISDDSSSSTAIQPGSGFFDKAFARPEDSIHSTISTARFRAVARIGRQVAEALQYAHDRGILHRDVKPSNLILDRQEVCWLSDFGLAKVHLEAAEITESDDLIGTMKYMSPEALSGAMDERSDLYSLGLTLYELATLHPVLDAVDRGQLLEQVKDPHAVPPRRFAPEIPRDLETVILKAISVDPNQRYRTAADLADDLGRFLDHEPIKARPQSTWTKLRRWVERKPLLAFLALGTISITATSLFSFASLYFSARQSAQSARLERDRSNLLRDEAEVSRQATDASRRTAELLTIEAQQQLIQVQRSKAAARLQFGDDFGSLVWTAETLRLLENVNSSPLDSNEPRANRKTRSTSLTERSSGDLAATVLDRNNNLHLEPTLRLRAGAVAQFAPRVMRRVWLPKMIHQWSSLTSENIDVRRHSWNEDRILFDATGRQLVLANANQTRQIQWDLPTGKFEDSQPVESRGTFVYTRTGEARIVYEPDGRLTYLATDAEAGCQTLEMPIGHAIQRPLGAWQSVDKKFLLISFQPVATLETKGNESIAWLWDLNSGYLANASPLRLDAVDPEIEFSRDCSRLFVRSNRSVQVLEVAGWKPLLSNSHIDAATTAWSRDGKWLALKSGTNTALYRIGNSADGASHAPVPQLIESPGLHGIRFEESGDGMALLLQRGHIAFLSIGERQKAQFRDFSHPHEIDIRDFNYSPDGQWYALAYNDGDVRIWSVHYNQPITGLMRHSSAVTSVAWSPGGDLLGTLTQDGLLTVWDVRPACATGQIFFHPIAGRLNTVRFSPDGSRVAAGGTQGTPAVWNLMTGQLECLPLLNGAALYDVGLEGNDEKEGDSQAAKAAAVTAPTPNEAKRQYHDQSVQLRRNPLSIAGFPNPEIQRLDWNDKGDLLAAICGNRKQSDVVTDEHLMLRVWETQHGLGLPVRSWPYRTRPGRISMPRFANGNRLLTHSTSHADLTGWQGGSAHARFQTDRKGWLAFTRLSPDERLLAVARDAGIVSLFRVADGELVAKLPLPAKQEIRDLTFNQTGTQLAVVGNFGLQVWDTTSGDALMQPEDGPFIRLQQVSFSPDDRHLATITENHVCQIHNTATWERSATTFQLESRPILAKFNPDNQTFLTVTETGILQIWDWSRGELLTPPLRNVQSVQDADLSRDGTHLVVMSPNAVRVWKLAQPDRRSVSQIATWARDMTLAAVDVEASTLVPLVPKKFPDLDAGSIEGQKSDSPFTSSARILWHVHQAKEAFLNLDEVAAEFHILRLQEIEPEHRELKSLKTRLKELKFDLE